MMQFGRPLLQHPVKAKTPDRQHRQRRNPLPAATHDRSLCARLDQKSDNIATPAAIDLGERSSNNGAAALIFVSATQELNYPQMTQMGAD